LIAPLPCTTASFICFVPDNGSAEDFMGGQRRNEPPRAALGLSLYEQGRIEVHAG
jgi:hypothetical protein